MFVILQMNVNLYRANTMVADTRMWTIGALYVIHWRLICEDEHTDAAPFVMVRHLVINAVYVYRMYLKS